MQKPDHKDYRWKECRKSFKVILTKLENYSTKFSITHSKIVTINEHSLLVEVPKNSCQTGHNLTGRIKSQGLNQDVDMEITFKVGEMSAVDSIRVHIECVLSNYDTKSWQILQNSIHRRQEAVTDLFETLRGIEREPR